MEGFFVSHRMIIYLSVLTHSVTKAQKGREDRPRRTLTVNDQGFVSLSTNTVRVVLLFIA